MIIRLLHPATDRATVDAFFQEAADYIRIERDEEPGPDVTEEFFTDAPPGIDPATSHRVGIFEQDHLIGLADLSFGYPAAGDAFLGLMMFSPAGRGKGAGAVLLRHLEQTARDRGATCLYLAVLDANPRGRTFWEREGFAVVLTNRPVTLGKKTQMASRMSKRL